MASGPLPFIPKPTPARVGVSAEEPAEPSVQASYNSLVEDTAILRHLDPAAVHILARYAAVCRKDATWCTDVPADTVGQRTIHQHTLRVTDLVFLLARETPWLLGRIESAIAAILLRARAEASAAQTGVLDRICHRVAQWNVWLRPSAEVDAITRVPPDSYARDAQVRAVAAAHLRTVIWAVTKGDGD